MDTSAIVAAFVVVVIVVCVGALVVLALSRRYVRPPRVRPQFTPYRLRDGRTIERL